MIRLRSKNLFDDMTLWGKAHVDVANGFQISGWSNNIMNEALCKALFVEGETYTFSYDWEFANDNYLLGDNDKTIGFLIYFNNSSSIGLRVGSVGSNTKGRFEKTFVAPTWGNHISFDCLISSSIGADGKYYANAVNFTNVMLTKGDKALSYQPYMTEPQRIMTRTRNLFAPTYIRHSKLTKEDNGFVGQLWGDIIMSHENVVKIFKPSKTYTLSYDVEFTEVPLYTYVTESVGLSLFDNVQKVQIVGFRKSVPTSQFVEGNKIHITITQTMPSTLTDCVVLGYSGYCRNADENNKWYYVTTRFSNIMLTEGTEEVDYVPYMSEVKTVAWGVKDECKLMLNGSEPWVQYSSGTTWVGTYCGVSTNAHRLRDAQYNNYWGFQDYDNPDKFLWLQPTAAFIVWNPGSPPYPSWETKDANGKAIANIPQIKADLAKKPLIVYYDNTNSKPKTLAELLKIVRREVYNQFIAVVDGDTLSVSGKMSDGVLELDSNKVSVSDSTLQLGGVIPLQAK